MTITRLLGTWALLAVAMTMNGILREVALRPWMGRAADSLSVLLGAGIIVAVTGLLFRPFRRHSDKALLQSSLLLVALTVAFEFAIGRWVDRKTWSELFANYAVWRGALWPFLLLLVAATPFIWGRWTAEPRAD